MLDERTSNICRFLHGRVFAVRDALHSFEAADKLRNPEAIKSLNPWPREDGAGLYIMRDGRRIDIAAITRSGVGAWDDLGEFKAHQSNAGLAELGLGFPPYHGLCRTTTMLNLDSYTTTNGNGR